MTVERANAPKIYSDDTTWVSREQIEPRFFEHVTAHSLKVKKKLKFIPKYIGKLLVKLRMFGYYHLIKRLKKASLLFERCAETEKGPCALKMTLCNIGM